ncbi:hypothetical protein J4Q44_G00383880 [Coregonus suidteri]|uniref:Uncharacterized protein n=1 Tax=Coregonus suidteri TaxID=861788 RepID=A0AAN8KLT9_9TELE
MDTLTDDVSAATSVHDIVPRSERCLSQATSTHRSGISQASSDVVVEYMSELHANYPDTALPVRCNSTAVADTETRHVPSARVKKKSQGRRFSCCPNLPTVKIKLFKSRVEPRANPLKRSCLRSVSAPLELRWMMIMLSHSFPNLRTTCHQHLHRSPVNIPCWSGIPGHFETVQGLCF